MIQVQLARAWWCIQLSKYKLSYSVLVSVISWGQMQLRINFTQMFKVFTKWTEFENFENASEINT